MSVVRLTQITVYMLSSFYVQREDNYQPLEKYSFVIIVITTHFWSNFEEIIEWEMADLSTCQVPQRKIVS